MGSIQLATEVLVIGAGGAGMYAALEASRRGAQVLMLDRSLIGRGGATVMAQMTVAAAVAPDGEDHWRFHLADTLAAGRGLSDPALAALLCKEGAECILEMDRWKVGWARDGARLRQVQAPGHDRARCVYVDFLNTGPAVSRTLRAQVQRAGETLRRLGEIAITDLVRQDGVVTGVVGVHVASGAAVTIAAQATIAATGGLTRLYGRNSASANMSGDGYALALRAGGTLVDMEFVQFFPIGHLAPRLVGMDPIMWDPFRYKLGGRLLNGDREEFLGRWGGEDDGRYARHARPCDLCDHQGGAGRARFAGRGRLAQLRPCRRGGAAGRLRPGHRPACGEWHRPDPRCGGGRADRALPHGRHPR